MADDVVTSSPTAIIVAEENFQLGGFIPGKNAGDVLDARGNKKRRRKGDQDPDELGTGDSLGVFQGGMIKPPVDPRVAISAVATNGTLAAVCQVSGEGAAGVKYEIVPRFPNNASMKDFKIDDPSTWPPEAVEQRKRIQVLVQAGFQGRGAKSLRAGFYETEHDRAILGWCGVIVLREAVIGARPTMPAPTRAFGAFEAAKARFTRPDRRFTTTPVPIALEDGSIVWIEEKRRFRRIRLQLGRNQRQGALFQAARGGFVWLKEYGDWRSMDARTGKYSTGNRWTPSMKPFEPGEYRPGKLPKGAVPAQEVMYWQTHFPSAYPYGLSAWHSELSAVEGAAEQTSLVLAYLKTGLHSVILAAANRPFEDGVVDTAAAKIDELGRGRKGLGGLVTLALVPADSDVQRSGGDLFGQNKTDDRGRIVLHEISTKLAPEIADGSLHESLSVRIENSERIPALLLGKSDSYNFATASAAWEVVNRLKFEPRHEEREAFLNRFLIEQDITFWTLGVESHTWDEKEPLSGVASVAGQMGGMTVNRAMKLLSQVMDVDLKNVEEWWGDVPFPLVEAILKSPNPQAMADALGLDVTFEEGAVIGAASSAVDEIEEAAESKRVELQGS